MYLKEALLFMLQRESVSLFHHAQPFLLTSNAADLIQDMYLKGLREYKAPAQKASDAEGHVQKFSPPAAPKSPEDANLASEMKAYEDQTVEIEGQAATGETQEPEEDYFEDLKHIDGKLSTGEAHH